MHVNVMIGSGRAHIYILGWQPQILARIRGREFVRNVDS